LSAEKEDMEVFKVMYLSMVCPRMGGAGNPRGI